MTKGKKRKIVSTFTDHWKPKDNNTNVRNRLQSNKVSNSIDQ